MFIRYYICILTKKFIMKKIMFLIASFTIGASVVSFAQKSTTETFVQTSISAGVDRIVNENVELGIGNKYNRVSIVGQSFISQPNGSRKYLAGLKYLRLLPVLPNLSATLSVAAKTRVDNTALFVVEPGAGFDFDLGKGVSLVTGVSSPITQTSFNERKTNIAGNIGLLIKL